MSGSVTTNNRLGWMLDQALQMPETISAVLLSADGLLMAHSQGITVEDAERTAAAVSGLQSLARATGEFCRQPPEKWRQTLIEFDGGFVFLTSAGQGAYVAVSTTGRVDIEGVSSRLQELVQRLGQELTAPPRFPAEGPGNPA
ncbi:roadblock/LC7 domain-containing protein [Amycolatopsis umgeniensis]|uniref:Putative regulator of Ras-like GTPase activity (Roadblock/LC7/MglB family) n=1 Tax=Amycolatopsis umgeniensis TaxID=336628 RepID=A0A841BAU0_9PSEU|nr:putative regulator of Ras-like GTPase activity (Roadblock/LC7/MglB family) [Amycolatopsis umgeniensis]